MFDILEIEVADLLKHKNDYVLVDVREPQELLGPEGQIEGIIPATMGSALAHFLSSADPTESYVFICRSGHRSAQSCEIARTYGLHEVYNLRGGMLAWNEWVSNNNARN